MVTLSNKLSILLLGSLLGAVCGLITNLFLENWGLYLAPACVFWVGTAWMAWLWLKPREEKLALLFPLYFASYLACLIFMPAMTLKLGVGAFCVAVSLQWLLGLRTIRILILTSIVISVMSIFLDVFLNEVFLWIEGSRDSWTEGRPGGQFGYTTRLIIFLWQTIMMAAITLQLYAERRYRQRIATKAATEGGPP
jgi:hypothetical protein